MWSNFNKKATQLGIVRGSFSRRVWWSGRGHEDMSSVKKNTHKSHYLNFPVPKCPSTYLTLNLLSPKKLIQQEWCVFLFNPSTPKSDWLLISPHSITHESNVEVTRIKEMITNLRSSWSSNKLKKKNKLEYFYPLKFISNPKTSFEWSN